MNKIYKLVWSKTKSCYVVASELAKSHTKSPNSGRMGRSLVAGVLACVLSCGAVVPAEAATAEWSRGGFDQTRAEQYYADRYQTSGGVVVDVVAITNKALQKKVMDAAGMTWHTGYYGSYWVNSGDDIVLGYAANNDGKMVYYLVTQSNGTKTLYAALNMTHGEEGEEGQRHSLVKLSNADLSSAGLDIRGILNNRWLYNKFL